MSPDYDAFGRTREESSRPATPRPGATIAEPIPPAPPARPAPRPRRGLGGYVLVLLLLVGGGAAIAATLREAVDRAAGQPQAVRFALKQDPLGPRSLLRAAPLRRALHRIERELRPGERAVSLTVVPERAIVTVVDQRDQQRWVIAGAAGDLHDMSLSSSADDARGIDFGTLALRPVARFVARKYRALAPYAREPTFSLTRDMLDGRPAGWVVSFSGVRRADASWRIDPAGRIRP